MATESQPGPSTEGRGARTFLRKAISFPALLGGLLLAEVFAFAYLSHPDPDTWWHVVVGEQILSTGVVPTVDTYSHTVGGTDWMAYEWLGEVLLALADRAGGLQGRTLGLMLMAGTLILLLYYYSYLRCGNSKAAFVAAAVLAPLAALVFTPRPQLLGYIFLLITLILLERYRQGNQKALWILPGLFLVWANTHGTFIFGMAVLGGYWFTGLWSFRVGGLRAECWSPEQRRHLLVIALLSLIALTITPYGTRIAAYPLQMALTQPVNLSNIIEWQPMPFDLEAGKYFLIVLLGFLLAQAINPQNYRAEEMGLFLFALYAATVHRRFVVIFVMVLAPLLARMLARWIPPYDPGRDRYLINAVLLGLAAVILVARFPTAEAMETRVGELYPRGAVEYLREHPVDGPVFNHYGWGGYLIWSLYPENKVFIDGRADLYEYAGVFSDYLHAERLQPETLTVLRRHGIKACLLERDAPLGTLLTALPEWEVAYEDELSRLFVHK